MRSPWNFLLPQTRLEDLMCSVHSDCLTRGVQIAAEKNILMQYEAMSHSSAMLVIGHCCWIENCLNLLQEHPALSHIDFWNIARQDVLKKRLPGCALWGTGQIETYSSYQSAFRKIDVEIFVCFNCLVSIPVSEAKSWYNYKVFALKHILWKLCIWYIFYLAHQVQLWSLASTCCQKFWL